MRLALASYAASCNFGDALLPLILKGYLRWQIPELEVVDVSYAEGCEEYGMQPFGAEAVAEADAVLLFGGSVFFSALLERAGLGWLPALNGRPLLVWGGVQYAEALRAQDRFLAEQIAQQAMWLRLRWPDDLTLLNWPAGTTWGGDLMLLRPHVPATDKCSLAVGGTVKNFPINRGAIIGAGAWATLRFGQVAVLKADPTSWGATEFGLDLVEYSYPQHVLLQSLSSAMMIGTKLHPLVVHLTQERPAVAACDSGKVLGLFRAAGIEEFCLDARTDVLDGRRFVALCERAWEEREQVSARLHETMPVLRHRTRQTLTELTEVLRALCS